MQSLGRGTRGPCAEGCWCAWLCAAAAVCAVVAEVVALIIALWLAVLVVSSDALAVIFTVVSIPSLENPRDEGAWWAAVSGTAQSRTRLKRLI